MNAQSSTGAGARSPFVPMLLLAAAVLAVLVFQATQLVRDRSNLQQLRANQQQPIAEAQSLRAQLDGVAADTARLAEQGNVNARKVIEELEKRGIKINPERAAAAGTATPE
jgi:hypothetical protein